MPAARPPRPEPRSGRAARPARPARPARSGRSSASEAEPAGDRRQPPRRGSGPRGNPSARGDRRAPADASARGRKLPAPELPEGADPKLLDRAARQGLRGLPETLAHLVAAHLVAAGQLLDDDPAAADRHARYARQLAPRLPAVREAVALTAYRAGDYATALSEMRALRRMSGDPGYLPVMADCERGLGRPERAIALSRDPAAAGLDPAGRAELAIVVSGARRDRAEYQAAIAALRPYVQSKAVRPWTVRLWYAYADALLDAGQRDEAREWFASAAAIDEDEETDAGERLAELDPGTGPAA